MGTPIERFNELAENYEAFTDRMPTHEAMNEAVLELFEQMFTENPPRSICELGSGTGTMARTLVEEYQPERYLALDGAEKMVERSIDTFSDYNGPSHVRFEQQPFEDWTAEEAFDCVYSSLAIHHLTHEDKRQLFGRIYDSLERDGWFLYADLFAPPESLAEFYYNITRTRQLNLGTTEEEFRERWQSHLDNDRPSPWKDSLEWLEDAGFTAVDCAWKNMNRAVIIARG